MLRGWISEGLEGLTKRLDIIECEAKAVIDFNSPKH